MSYTNRIAEHVVNPSPEEIENECQMIRAHWTPEIKERRNDVLRFDSANKQAQANLRFLRFLAEFADS